jgi:hypothetical protein
MNTKELAAMLAHGGAGLATPAPRRMGMALAAGLASSALLLALVYGVRADMPELLRQPLFWLKVSFPLAVLLAALGVAARLARPGTRVGYAAMAGLALPPAALWLAGAGWLALAPPSLRVGLVLGSTWQVCTLNVALLSLPTLGAMFWFMRGLAPTRLAAAGAAAGLVAGAQGVLVYCLYCVEMAPPFWGVWYVLGMLAPAALGALAAPAMLRW